jgi:Arc/MetJ-type ribon-helix-helix transcriptional regulator
VEETMSLENARQAIEAAIHSGDFKSMGIAVFKAINALEERIKALEEENTALRVKLEQRVL